MGGPSRLRSPDEPTSEIKRLDRWTRVPEIQVGPILTLHSLSFRESEAESNSWLGKRTSTLWPKIAQTSQLPWLGDDASRGGAGAGMGVERIHAPLAEAVPCCVQITACSLTPSTQGASGQ